MMPDILMLRCRYQVGDFDAGPRSALVMSLILRDSNQKVLNSGAIRRYCRSRNDVSDTPSLSEPNILQIKVALYICYLQLRTMSSDAKTIFAVVQRVLETVQCNDKVQEADVDD